MKVIDFDHEIDAGEVAIIMTREELRICAGGLRETLEEVDEWEFETRMGATQAEVLELQAEIRSALLRADRADQV